MSEIKIKEESLPQRCEICHKADLLFYKINKCLRCKDIELNYQNVIKHNTNKFNFPTLF